VPATQGVHAEAFEDAEKVPAGQLTQAAAALYWPGVQTMGVQALEPATAVESAPHAAHEVAPAAAYVFDAQPPQPDEPVTDEYLPATQLTH